MKESNIIGLIDMVANGIESTEFNNKTLNEIEDSIVSRCVRDYNVSEYLAKYIAETIYSSKQNISLMGFGFQQ